MKSDEKSTRKQKSQESSGKSEESGWGFAPKKGGLATETKIGLAATLFLSIAFCFVVYKRVNEKSADSESSFASLESSSSDETSTPQDKGPAPANDENRQKESPIDNVTAKQTAAPPWESGESEFKPVPKQDTASEPTSQWAFVNEQTEPSTEQTVDTAFDEDAFFDEPTESKTVDVAQTIDSPTQQKPNNFDPFAQEDPFVDNQPFGDENKEPAVTKEPKTLFNLEDETVAEDSSVMESQTAQSPEQHAQLTDEANFQQQQPTQQNTQQAAQQDDLGDFTIDLFEPSVASDSSTGESSPVNANEELATQTAVEFDGGIEESFDPAQNVDFNDTAHQESGFGDDLFHSQDEPEQVEVSQNEAQHDSFEISTETSPTEDSIDTSSRRWGSYLPRHQTESSPSTDQADLSAEQIDPLERIDGERAIENAFSPVDQHTVDSNDSHSELHANQQAVLADSTQSNAFEHELFDAGSSFAQEQSSSTPGLEAQPEQFEPRTQSTDQREFFDPLMQANHQSELVPTAGINKQTGLLNSGTYVVQPRDSLWTISEKLYRTPTFYHALEQHNKRLISDTRQLKPGMVLQTPPAEVLMAKYPELMPQPIRQRGTTRKDTITVKNEQATGFFRSALREPLYRVGRQDTLTTIAQKHLGRASRWVQIYEMNRDRLQNPNKLSIGTVLRLPADARP